MSIHNHTLDTNDYEPDIAFCFELANAKSNMTIKQQVEHIIANQNYPNPEDKICAVGLYFVDINEFEDAKNVLARLENSQKALHFLNIINNIEDPSAQRELYVHTSISRYVGISESDIHAKKQAREFAINNLSTFQSLDLTLSEFARKINRLEFDLDIVTLVLLRTKDRFKTTLLSTIAQSIDKRIREHILERVSNLKIR